MPFSNIRKIIDSIDTLIIPGCDCAVHIDGKCVFRYSKGYSDFLKKKTVSPSDLYMIYSCTKVFTVVVIMKLIELGKLGLYDSVSEYLKEYEGKAVHPIRIVDLLTMCSGLGYDMDSRTVAEIRESETNTRSAIAALAQDSLHFEPGSDYLYGFSHDLLAVIAQEISGMPFDELLRKIIFNPLGMEHIGFSVSDCGGYTLSAQYRVDEKLEASTYIGAENEFILFPGYISGGAGLISTVDDIMRFADSLACTEKLISTHSIELMKKDWLNEKQRNSFHASWPHLRNYSYGLGVRTFVSNEDGCGGTPGEFGWEGAGGCFLLIDPLRHMSCFYAQHVRNCLISKQYIHREITRALYS